MLKRDCCVVGYSAPAAEVLHECCVTGCRSID